MNRFFYASELVRPEDAREYLADPVKHWRPGYSAYELSTSWIGAGDIPSTVREVLDGCDAFRGCELIEGFFERQVDLRTPGRPSQTDLMALVKLRNGLGVVAVEGKVAESFGPIVAEWNDGPGKQRRLESLCELLGLPISAAAPLRYQLLHRSASAVYEAERCRADDAMLLVHSFGGGEKSLEDYNAFARALALDGAGPDAVTDARDVRGCQFRLAWVSDAPSAT